MSPSIRMGALIVLMMTGGASQAWAQTESDVEAGIRAYTEAGDARTAIQRIGSALDAGNVPSTIRPRAGSSVPT